VEKMNDTNIAFYFQLENNIEYAKEYIQSYTISNIKVAKDLLLDISNDVERFPQLNKTFRGEIQAIKQNVFNNYYYSAKFIASLLLKDSKEKDYYYFHYVLPKDLKNTDVNIVNTAFYYIANSKKAFKKAYENMGLNYNVS
jgi:hypothetical protein